MTNAMPDIITHNHGSIMLFQPLTEAATEWIDTHIGTDAQYFGTALVVEPRYAEDIVMGMEADGLVIE